MVPSMATRFICRVLAGCPLGEEEVYVHRRIYIHIMYVCRFVSLSNRTRELTYLYYACVSARAQDPTCFSSWCGRIAWYNDEVFHGSARIPKIPNGSLYIEGARDSDWEQICST